MNIKLKNCSLYLQLIIPLLGVGIIGVCAAIYSANALEDSVSALAEFYVEGDEKLKVIEQIGTSLASYRALSLKHLASEISSEMTQINISLKDAENEIQKNINHIATVLIDEPSSSIDLVRFLKESTTDYVETINGVILLSADFEKELAFENLTLAENSHIPAINDSLRQLKRQEFDELSQSRETLVSAASRNLVVTIAVGIGGGSLFMFIAYIVTRNITRRLTVLLNWSKKISSGNLSARLVSGSLDEVGRLTSSMQEMANNIRIAHDELADAKNDAESTAKQLQIYANAFESSGEAIIITDRENRIINVNAAFTSDTGYSLEEAVGKDPRFLASGLTPEKTYQELWSGLNNKGFWQGELWDQRKNGHVYPKWISISALRDDEGAVLFYIASFTDITERKENEARIEHLAHHDILTGLHNRFDLENRLEQVIATSNREQQQLAVLFIDLDRFKNINDSLGHHMGDQLLVEVAKRLKKCARDSDIVARLGGDEFVIVLTAINDSSQAAFVADKIIKHITKPYNIDGHEMNSSPSIGISIYPDDGANVSELMRTADVAMYHAKDQGRNTYQYFTESMLVAANKRMQIERELRAALNSEQLLLYYQPQVNSVDMNVVSMEALIRWNRPEQGMIPPGTFIPIAEEAGFIHELGHWVIDEACRQLAAWKSAGIHGLRIAINLSVRQLQSESLFDEIKAILSKHQIQGNELEFEITETAAMSEPERAVQQLEALRKLGIRLSIDDFGTGYSSLAYLKRLPIQALKLDHSFVRDIEVDPNDAAICVATIALAHNLGLTIVGEGVETEAQRDFLLHHECDYLQGYYFAKPMPPEDMTKFISEKKIILKNESTEEQSVLENTLR